MKNSKIKRPNTILYGLVAALLRPYLYLRYGFKPDRSLAKGIEGPFIALCAHPSNLDFLFVVSAFYPQRFNIVATRHWFGTRRLAWLLRAFHCIPREQFHPDPLCIRHMMQVIREGGALLMYPEGEVSGIGRYLMMPRNVARLCKRLGVPVYCASSRGSYLSRPKWARGERRGRVEMDIECIATAQELRDISEEALFARMERALHYDDFAWQEQAMVPFRGLRPAEGLQNLLYRCPRCGAEFHMQSRGNALWCGDCGNRALMDQYGFLSPAQDGDMVFRHTADWVEFQRSCIRKELESPDFAIEAEGKILYYTDPRSLRGAPAGEGHMRLDRQAFRYTGTARGELVDMAIPIANVFKFPFGAGKDFEVPRDGERVAFKPDEPEMIEKFVLALPLIHEAEGK